MSDGGVQSVERAFALLEELSRHPGGMHLTELSEKAGLHKSTVHRMLCALSSLGYVKRADGVGKYALSLKLLELAGRVADRTDVLDVARSYLDALRDTAGETIHLVLRDGREIVYIYKAENPQNAYRLFSQIGMRRPLYCTAAGKSILATLSDKEIASVFEQSEVKAYTEHTITTLSALYRELDSIRSLGYALDNEENEPGVRCIAAAVYDATGRSRAAFSVSAPIVRLNDEKLNALIPHVLMTAQNISAELGGQVTGYT